jgi:uncharacterized protein YprB with RNaseH-like and TPR domain
MGGARGGVLTTTFCCFRGVSQAAERRLWQVGCCTWKDLMLLDQPRLSSRKLASVRQQIREAQVAFAAGMADYFLNRLSGGSQLRVLPHFLEGVGYLDIETTGLGCRDRITVIGLLTQGRLASYVRGRDLEGFLAAVSGLSLLVTYNGTQFDLPRLRQEFGIDLAAPHIDLMYCLRALGVRGGAKSCERSLGFRERPDAGLSGVDAPDLWGSYQRYDDESALMRLVRYNAEDVLALEHMALRAYNIETIGMPNAPRLKATPRL